MNNENKMNNENQKQYQIIFTWLFFLSVIQFLLIGLLIFKNIKKENARATNIKTEEIQQHAIIQSSVPQETRTEPQTKLSPTHQQNISNIVKENLNNSETLTNNQNNNSLITQSQKNNSETQKKE